MIYLIVALIAVHGLPLARSAFVSVGSWLTLVLVDGRAGSVNIAALVYTGFLSLLMALLSIHNRRLLSQERRVSEIRTLALCDELTGLPNRRALQARLDSLVAVGSAQGALVFLDLDHFKRVNDTAGHQAGDQVLREVAGILQGQTRRVDPACRWGGEEFVLLLEDLDHASAVATVKRIQGVIRRTAFFRTPRLTVSAGLAMLSEGRTPGELIALADARLYRAKAAGRDCLKSRAPAATLAASGPGRSPA